MMLNQSPPPHGSLLQLQERHPPNCPKTRHPLEISLHHHLPLQVGQITPPHLSKLKSQPIRFP
ncbi:hypothetical protein DL93DRAFT_2078791 [Clavulina sp. PMI_390]|nr:hypothetical protein DL93DRAFT_2078791 [Clavulina sp. PMI_390]